MKLLIVLGVIGLIIVGVRELLNLTISYGMGIGMALLGTQFADSPEDMSRIIAKRMTKPTRNRYDCMIDAGARTVLHDFYNIKD